jgi:hypothetical protein
MPAAKSICFVLSALVGAPVPGLVLLNGLLRNVV